MTSLEQRELTEYIKYVHLSLRRNARRIGAGNAWREHLENADILSVYARNMKLLAEKYWSTNNNECRIQWMVRVILCYFQEGIHKESDKEIKKLKLFSERKLGNVIPTTEIDHFESPYKLLDVGSCYDPFGKVRFFDTYPIDLCPAKPEVKKCNFLEVDIKDLNQEIAADWFQSNVDRLPSNFFDIVVFSLFLEYLPSPKQRFICCEKAYEALRTNGLLLVATPDSKHATANSALMKSWKIALAHIGFVRIRINKLRYIYCMAFRKSVSKEYPMMLHNISKCDRPEELIVIPQDSVNYDLEEKEKGISAKSVEEENILKESFNELPFEL